MPNNAPMKYAKIINLRVTQEQAETLSEAAWKNRKTLSAYIRDILDKHTGNPNQTSHERQAATS